MKSLFFLDELVGSYWFLNQFPIFVYIVIYVLFYSILLVGRWMFEGRAYDVALSSKYGDMALGAFVVYAASMIKQQDFQTKEFMQDPGFHWIVVIVSIVITLIYIIITKPAREMDIWHGIITVPLFLYLIGTIAPVYYYASSSELALGVLLIAIWIILVIYDVLSGRMDQRKWIHKNRRKWVLRN